MTQLEGCISFWEATLKDKFLMSISTAVLVERTVVFLKKLQRQEVEDGQDITRKGGENS
ncbi:hypothetical protein ES703_64139 [subsurface metagenome]